MEDKKDNHQGSENIVVGEVKVTDEPGSVNELDPNPLLVEPHSANDYDNEGFDKLKMIFDFQFDAVKEASAILEKGIAFFSFIIAALTGYILNKKDEIELVLQVRLLLGAILVTILVLICVSALAWGVYTGLRSIKETLHKATESVWKQTSISAFLNRGIFTSLIIGIAGSFLMLVILIFFVELYNEKSNELNRERHKMRIEKAIKEKSIIRIDSTH